MAGIFSLQIPNGFLRRLQSISARPVQTAPLAQEINKLVPSAVTSEQFLDKFSHSNDRIIPIGVTDAAQPLWLDLDDPQPGPILVLSDDIGGNRNLLKVLAQSACANRSVPEINFLVVSSQPDDWKSWLASVQKPERCLVILDRDGSDVGDWIIRLAEQVEQRFTDRETSSPILLLIDGLDMISRAESDVQLNFEWLCQYAPGVQVWPVATLTTDMALEMGRWIRHFHTRLIGKMPNQASIRLGLSSGLESEGLADSRQYAVRIQDEWISFWLPINSSISKPMESGTDHKIMEVEQ
jgi:hypothetical protein